MSKNRRTMNVTRKDEFGQSLPYISKTHNRFYICKFNATFVYLKYSSNSFKVVHSYSSKKKVTFKFKYMYIYISSDLNCCILYHRLNY